MKKLLAAVAIAGLAGGCSQLRGRIDRIQYGENPYAEQPFYARYLDPSSTLDRQIAERITALRENPASPTLHNELGALLVAKGFPNDAEREFNRALSNDPDFYPAKYNLALIREAKGDIAGAKRALRSTVRNKPGHAIALFHLGLLEERTGNDDAAIELYSRALRYNRALLDVRVNPRVLDSELMDRALLLSYPEEHAERAIRFQGAPVGYVDPPRTEISKQPTAEEIITPVAPVTDPSAQPPAPPAPAPAPPVPPAPQPGTQQVSE